MNNLRQRSHLTSNPELVTGRSAAAQAFYLWCLFFYPLKARRIERERQHRREFPK